MINAHPRVFQGLVAQQIAQSYLIQHHSPCDIVSTAPHGSHRPDIVAIIKDVPIQCEVKHTFKFTSPVVTINKTVKRGSLNLVDELVPVMTSGTWNSVEEAVDYHRLTDTTIGFPGDINAPYSGKLPKCLKIIDEALLTNVRLAIRNNFHERQDTYLILVCKRPTLATYIFYTGYSENILAAPELPQLSMAKLRTYGSARKDSMRVALKVSFILP
jgi:hypothetical protein